MIRAVLVLPLVPVTWMTGKVRCGSPSSSMTARIRSSDGSRSCSGARERIERLDLAHPSVQLELVRGIALGGIGGRAHPPIVHAGTGRSVRARARIRVPNMTLWVA